MGRLCYEKSVSHCGYLIIPFTAGRANGIPIFSWTLLSDAGHEGKYHKAVNPAGLYSDDLQDILDIAREFLGAHADNNSTEDYFKERYTYRNQLIIIHESGGKYFYDHYPAEELNNIAAPKIFTSAAECLEWVSKGLNRPRRSDSSLPHGQRE